MQTRHNNYEHTDEYEYLYTDEEAEIMMIRRRESRISGQQQNIAIAKAFKLSESRHPDDDGTPIGCLEALFLRFFGKYTRR